LESTFTFTDSLSIQELLTGRYGLLQCLKFNLTKAQNYLKNQGDKRRRDLQFVIGDLVSVKLQPYRQHSMVLRKNQKLSCTILAPLRLG